ncbi:uncharacterized protein ATC70_011427 [Mucor velutinosus]|uniref:Exosome nuclease subunit n=1 Tax=Mucor velutinosus TaxID=708070 RepID=A0AAN7D5D1_9FUNG|nr:hypothetical protein ATC70_004878 [Mucor velutinosus]KAK4515541.1 exosome nuclease subunit [Mucor velutinosus]KAK4516455.1 hypothetical protein ATC70_011427 [Mucor velutinosus]
MNNNTKHLNIKVGSLNCRNLHLNTNQHTTDTFIGLLKDKKLNILLCQETNIPSHSFEEVTDNMKIKFNYHQAIWTQHCAIINFNNSLNLEKIKESNDGRMILAKLSIADNSIPPVYILNLYARSGIFAEETSQRNQFYKRTVEMLLTMPEIIPDLIMAGDFNYSFDSSSNHATRRIAKPKHLINFVKGYMNDCINTKGEKYTYTCIQKRRERVTLSTIDYIFAGTNTHKKMHDGDVEFFSDVYTDHALITITLTVEMSNNGKGIWRANPHLAKNKRFTKKLSKEINNYVQHKLDPDLSAQVKWDLIKNMAKKVTTNFCRHHNQWRETKLKQLNSERNRILRLYGKEPLTLKALLPPIHQEISKIQEEKYNISKLRAGKRWMEQNENSPAYIKKTIDRRLETKTMPMLKHPTTVTECTDTKSKLDAVHTFYSKLYSPERIDINSMEGILNHITVFISQEESDQIIDDIPFAEIFEGSRRSPKSSSPGLDGLPYEILHVIASQPICQRIITQVYNDAIKLGIFPKSWQQACVVLLPKKGDLSDLSNWRPITLINTDCKVFTRIMNSRITTVASRLINKVQTGFMQDRYIGDQGMALRVMMDNAKTAKGNNKDEFEEYVGVMLDNNKAYDRVHPHYLAQVLQKFGFPMEFIRCIENLFFGNEIFINMNGFLTKPVKQKRGLRQGDSISPILFNFAIEPFILSIINSQDISGYSIQPTKPAPQRTIQLNTPPPTKIMAYADDILIFVKSRTEYMAMEECIKTYGKASNSKINYDKSLAFPLHGGRMEGYFGTRLKTYTQQRMKWFDYSSPEYIKYLGYPIYYTIQQRDCFIADLTAKIKAQVEFLKPRKISMYGKANVANTIILSKLWHVLRLTPLPKATINKLNSIIYQYIVDEKRLQIKKDVYYLPKDQGGLGLLHVGAQQQTLQMRYITALLYHDQHKTIPQYLYQLMSHTLQMETNLPYIDTILIFKEARSYKNNLKDGAMKLIIETMNSLLANCRPDFTNTPININTCLTLPLTTIYKDWEDLETTDYLRNPTAKRSLVQDFFKPNLNYTALEYKTRQECKSPQILYKLKRDHNNNQLHLQDFFSNLLHPNNSTPNNQEEAASLIQHFEHDSNIIWLCKNKIIRQLLLKQLPIQLPKDHNKNINPKQWKAFYRSHMHQSPRNLWLKIIYNKVPCRSFLYQSQIKDIENNRCIQCNEVEDARHLLMECGNKHDVWESVFKEHLSYPTTINTHRIYKDMQNLTLSRYYIYNLDLKINIFDLFATIIRIIWTHHFFVHYRGTPFEPQTVVSNINRELDKLSKMDSIDL